MDQWSKEEIRLTRFAWSLYDADRAVRRGILVEAAVAACMGVACVALFIIVAL